MGKIREGKAVISLPRSISLSKQIFNVKLKLKEKKDDVWLGIFFFPLKITTIARQLLENRVCLMYVLTIKKKHAKKKKISKPILTSQSIETN